MEHPRDTTRPLILNTCINKVNIMWEWGLVSKGGTMLQGQKNNIENVTFRSYLFYINHCVLWQFLRTILHVIWQSPLILSICNLHLKRIVDSDKFLSSFCVFAYFKKPSRYCVSLYYSHTFLKNSHLTFGLIASGLQDQLRIKWYLML